MRLPYSLTVMCKAISAFQCLEDNTRDFSQGRPAHTFRPAPGDASLCCRAVISVLPERPKKSRTTDMHVL